jgi:Predicted heme/steroid binding protein
MQQTVEQNHNSHFFCDLHIFGRGVCLGRVFYQSGVPDSAIPSAEQNQTQNISESDARIFTAQELARYDGKNGNPAYIAVDGTVYDVSGLYINGTHKGCSAGKDATAEFYQDHSKQILTRYPIMGTLK